MLSVYRSPLSMYQDLSLTFPLRSRIVRISTAAMGSGTYHTDRVSGEGNEMRIIMGPRVRVRIIVVGTVLMLLLPMVGASPVGAATRCVAPGGAGGCFATIQAAITASATNDTITVAAGTYNERITINKNL